MAALPLAARPAILDVGCGEGFYLGNLASGRSTEAHGIDLSIDAIDLAARRWPALSWFVVNADRVLPYADAAFDVALSLTARRNAPELHRVLRPQGRLIVALPGEDDLIELRAAVLGEAIRRDRVPEALAAFAPCFELESIRTLRRREALGADAVRDLLAATYRAARLRERERVGGLGALEVTQSFDLLVLVPI